MGFVYIGIRELEVRSESNRLDEIWPMKTRIENIIQEQPFFRGFKPDHLKIIIESAREAAFEPAQVLFREGEPANQFYVIESGLVALEAHEPARESVQIQKVGPGEVLGWSWLFPPFTCHFQARAVEPTQALILNGAHLLVAAESNHDFGYCLMKRVAQVVIQRLGATRGKLLAIEAGGSSHCEVSMPKLLAA